MKESFGQRLARLRKKKGLTQEGIASNISISPQAVSKWENDISTPDIYVLSQLADILGVSVDELLGREELDEDTLDAEEEAESVESEVVDDDKKKKDNSYVHIGLDGIHVEDDDATVDIDVHGIHVDEHGEGKTKVEFGSHKEEAILNGIMWGVALIGFLLMGLLWKDDNYGWKVGWILFLLPPIISSTVSAIKHRRFTRFAYPVLVTGAYCALGLLGMYFRFPGWEGYWFLFITIPAYYFIFGSVDKLIHRGKKSTINICCDDDDDDDDD